MKNLAFTFVAFSCLAIAVSCSSNKDELPEPGGEIVVAAANTNSVVVTYNSHVQSIMGNCTGCHSANGQSPALVTYSNVKAIADDGRLLLWAIQGGGSQPMPQGGLLPQATRDTLQFWLDQQALEQ